MPSPFPGMKPYLEQSAFWSSFHTRLLVAIADTVAPQLRPKYYIEVETRTYQDSESDEVLVGVPDATVLKSSSSHPAREKLQSETGLTLTQKRPQSIALPMPITVKERYLEVREIGSDTVITVIEVLSPKNKQKGSGRTAYEKKRGRVLGSLSHLIEIDLLRAHSPMTMLGKVQPTDYRIVVSRSPQRPKADLYGFNLPEPIPSFPLPLSLSDEELSVDLQPIVDGVCERAGYNDRIDYSQPVPPPKLSQANQQWVEELLAPIRGGNGASR
ncbi:hypothetical protein WA1_09925 [Scytonema hofmannii PCC 7110]|uniref:DUF4058 domain-containing protein n=1 Tax=Scytonema hofmannii PCC 7110 TaxID=128403 RepID=A0A139WRI2_9CYAN|nr:DUF4058 family protein [Scytonema hofmannii]KYC35044.1 hypothetical protein WA1_09925 [Scytonema hofmannii PCC 7110]